MAKLLLVHPDRAERSAIQRQLVKCSHMVAVEQDQSGMLRMLRTRTTPSLILMDIRAALTAGEAMDWDRVILLVIQLGSEFPYIQIILITGHESVPQDRITALANVADFWPSSMVPEKRKESVDAALHKGLVSRNIS